MPPQTVRLFVSSPGDVTEERIVAARVTQRLQDALVPRVILAPVFWEHEPLRATETFQSQIVRPSDTDIVICILWSRLGTRLPPQFTRPDGSRYASGTEYEFEDAVTGYRHNGKPDLLVYRKVTEPVISLKDTQVARDRLAQMEALEQFITKWFHGLEDGSLIAAFHTFDTSAQFESLLEVHLRKLIEPRLPARVSEDVIRHAPPSWPHGSPFRGLEVFNVEHAPIFFGRTRAVGEVIHILRQQATGGRVFVLVLGMSGSGKSSLIRAGILPTMTHPGVIEGVGLWRWGICRLSNISSDLPFGIAKLLLDDNVLPELAAAGVNAEALAEAFRSAPQQAKLLLRIGLSRASEHVAKREQLAAPPEARLVLVVDQMEELFTLDALSQSDRDGCIALLSILANSGVVWVIGSMRSDFYHRTAELPSLVALTEGLGQYHLLPPSHAEILQIIREPVRAAGLTFEEDPATGIGLDTVIEQAAIRHPEALPLLEFTLDELFKQRSENNMLTMAAYKQLGGLEGALGRRAEEAFQSLSEAEKTALPSVLRALVNVTLSDNSQITARTASMSMFPEGTPARALVDTFLSPEYRLFVADGDGQGTRVRVAHEALFSVWELARDIILTDREFLRTRQRVEMASARWEEEQQPDDLLLPLGKPLAEAEDLLVQRRKELSPEVVAYIETSSTVQREKERLAREAAEREAETAHLLARRRRAAAITRRVAFFGLLAWLAFFLWLGEWYWSPVRHLVFDTSQRLFPRQVEHFPVVIIDIDEASLAALGQWPWPRTRLARLIEAVQRMGALVVGLSMVMPETDRLSPSVFVADRPDVSAALRDELATLPSNDAILAETLRRVPTVVGRVGLVEPRGDVTPASGQASVMVSTDTSVAQVQTYVDHIINVSPIEEAAAGHGYLNASWDADGVVRTTPLLLSIHGKLAPAFALELVRVAVDKPWYTVHGGPRGVHGVQIGTSFIPTDLDGRIRLYYSPADGRRRVSALSVLNGNVDRNALAQRVALIGITGVGLTDVAVTPVATGMDGVEVQAQVVENILAGTRLVRPFAARWVEFGIALLAGLLVLLLLRKLKLLWWVTALTGMTALIAGLTLVVFVRDRILIDPTFPWSTAILVYFILASGGTLPELFQPRSRGSQ